MKYVIINCNEIENNCKGFNIKNTSETQIMFGQGGDNCPLENLQL